MTMLGLILPLGYHAAVLTLLRVAQWCGPRPSERPTARRSNQTWPVPGHNMAVDLAVIQIVLPARPRCSGLRLTLRSDHIEVDGERVSGSGQSHEWAGLAALAFLRRPYGAPGCSRAAFPALKRWANEHRAYGASRLGTTGINEFPSCDCPGLHFFRRLTPSRFARGSARLPSLFPANSPTRISGI